MDLSTLISSSRRHIDISASTCDGGTAVIHTIDPTIPTTPCPTMTEGGTAQGAYCYFPFKAQGITFTECTRELTTSNRLWCATTYDYDTDQLWGYCAGVYYYHVITMKEILVMLL